MIRSLTAAVAALAVLPAVEPLLAQAAVPSVTLFNSGRSLVRRTVPVTLPAGSSLRTLELGLFDISSLAVLDPGVKLEKVMLDAAVDERALLRRHVGEVFTFDVGDNGVPVKARLLAIDPERWEILPGNPKFSAGVSFMRPGKVVWDPAFIPLAPIADLTLASDRARDRISVMYEAPGGSWQADYRLFLGQNSRLEGTATINAGQLSLENAEVQLLAGDIGVRRRGFAQGGGVALAAAPQAKIFDAQEMSAAEAVGEARLYTLPGRVSFVPGVQMALPLFPAAAVTPERRFTLSGALSLYGGIGQEVDEVELPVQVSYSLPHRLRTPFGDLALPAGGVSVYGSDAAGRVQLLGSGLIGQTAPGEDLEVTTGSAFDVTARRTQTEYTTSRTTQPARTTATLGYRITVSNAKDEAVTVEVREDRRGEWSVLSSSIPAVKNSASRATFALTVPAKGEATLTYRLRVVW